MKKIIVTMILLIGLMGCSAQKNPIDKYIKKDIVVEVGSKVTVDDVMDLEQVKNKNLKNCFEEAQLVIDYDNNTKKDGEITSDKVYANNNILVKYTYNKKDYEKDIEISIKDTKKPEVKITNNYVTSLLNQEKSEDVFISDLKPDIKDNGRVSSHVDKYDEIDFSKIGEHKLKLIVEDEAKNIVEKDVYLFVGKDSITYNYQTVRMDQHTKFINYSLIFPSSVTSYYDISMQKKNKMDDYLKGAFDQKFTLKSSQTTITGYVISGIPMGWNNVLKTYNWHNNRIIIDKGNENSYSSFIVNEGKGWIIINLGSSNISYDEIKRVTEAIASYSYEN